MASGHFMKITALRYNNTQFAAMIDTAGDIWHSENTGSSWSTPVLLSKPAGVTAWADIDMTWDEYSRGFMLAIPTVQSISLYFQPLYPTPYPGWRYFETHLYAPDYLDPSSGKGIKQPAPQMVSITASRWMEDPSGTTSPVVMGTDNQGNVYLVEYQRVRSPAGWDLYWKSFYSDTISYFVGP